MEYLGSFVLYGLYLHLVWWVLHRSVPKGLLQPLDGIQCNWMSAGPLELGQVLHQLLTTGKQSSGQPHQIPALFLRQTVPVVRQLLHDLTVHLVLQYLLLEGTLKYLVGQLIAGPCYPGR